MCFGPRKTIREPNTPPSTSPKPCRSDTDRSHSRRGTPIFVTQPVPNETKPEAVQNRLAPVIKGLLECDAINKSSTGGSSDCLAEKLVQKNKLDEEKDNEQTCVDEDCNYHNIRKDILAIVDKNSKKEEDTRYEHYHVKGRPKEDKKKERVVYKKDNRQSKEDKGSAERITTDHDSENDVNEKNFMYNLKEIDYCSHGILRCIEEDNLAKLISDNCRLPDKVQPYGDLEQLAKRRYTTCKVLRRNTLISTLLSMPSADEKEVAATATARHMTQYSTIKFLPSTTLDAHAEERDQLTAVDLSGPTGTAIDMSMGPQTALPLPAVVNDSSKRKKDRKAKPVDATEKTAEELQ